ncbi:MAG: DUF1631 domain-containing protein [Cellvibrionaceae bacterium]
MSDAKPGRAKVVPIKANNPITAKDRAKLARLPAPVHSVQEKGKQQLSKALRALFDNTDDALFALADKATSNHDQNLYFESMREVRIRRRQLESTFADVIDNAFVDLVLKGRPGASSGEFYGGDPLPAEGLSLVADDELEELVAVDSMIAKANSACGESLQYLSLRLDSLVPNKVYHKTNPLGPDVICNAFVSAARELEADIKAKLVLFKLFDQYVVSELPAIYDGLNATLIEHNVLPSLRHGSPPPRNSGASSGRAGGGTGTAGSAAQGQAIPSQGSGAASQGATAGGQTAGANQTAALSGIELLGALTEIQGQQTTQWSQPGATVSVAGVQTDIGGALLTLLKEQHGPRSLAQSQIETINLVKLLFEFILDDRSLAEPMKALIGRLQIPILKVALLDEAFFTKSGHPARRLLNEMATASLGWQENPKEEGAPKDPLYRKISDVVQRLLNEFEADVSLFNDVLADFVSYIEKERKRASILEQRTIDAEDGKAKAEAARRQVNAALKEIKAGHSIPSAVENILDRAWSNALFLICLKQGKGSEEWQHALQTARDLVWSVTVDITPESRQQLLGMIPHLVKRLREGLEKIAFNPFEMTQLLNQLEKLHLARLQGLGSNDPDSVPGESPQAQPESTAKTQPPPAEPTPDKEPAVSAAESSQAAADIDSSYLALISKLTQGTWFEMTDTTGKHYRCRLAAIIKATGKYIFVNRSGMKVAEETRDSLALAMKEDKLTLLDDTMLFDRALESVIGGSRKSRPN